MRKPTCAQLPPTQVLQSSKSPIACSARKTRCPSWGWQWGCRSPWREGSIVRRFQADQASLNEQRSQHAVIAVCARHSIVRVLFLLADFRFERLIDFPLDARAFVIGAVD